MAKKQNYMGYSKQSSQQPAYNSTGSSFHKETVQEILNNYSCEAVPQQNILKEDAEFYGIRSSWNEEPVNGQKVLAATYFPYYDQNDQLTAFKKRDWTLHKDDPHHFSVVGTLKNSYKMFGQVNCAQGTKRVYIVEGEGDVVAARRSLINACKMSERHKNKPDSAFSFNVVGLNMGTANGVECVAHNEKFIKSYEKIVLCLDNDQATPKEKLKGVIKGIEATDNIAAFLLSENLLVAKLPTGYKDPRSMLDAGLDKELGNILLWTKSQYTPEKIVSGNDVTTEELIRPLQKGLIMERYPKLMDKLQGIRINELYTYAAFSGVGKSTLAREVAWELINTGHKVGFIFLEEPRIKTQQALICLELGIKLPNFRADPLSCATREAIDQARESILANGKTFFLDHFGSIKVDKLMDQIKFLHFINGCEHIFIDHVSMAVAGLESNNERKDIDMLYESLASFMTVNPVAIHAVCHLKRVDDNKSKKKNNEPEQPYWREVRKEMLRGSGGIEQMSSTIIVLENEVLPDGTRGRVRTRVEKNREWSFLGVCDTMIQKEDGRMHCVEEDESFYDNPDNSPPIVFNQGEEF